MRAEDRDLLAFVALAFGWSWLLWAPRALGALGVTGLPRPPTVAAFGPTVAAFALAYRARGREGVLDLAGRAVDAGFPRRWWLPTLLLFPAINGGLLLLGVLLGEGLPGLPWAGEPLALPVGFLLVVLTSGPVQEEFGWRGYALDRFQARWAGSRWNALVSSLALGAVWAAWHAPLFLFDPAVIYRPENVVGFVPSILLVTVLVTWVYNNTGGSLLAAVLVHASFNFSHWALPVLDAGVAREAYPFVLLGVTVGVVLGWGPRDLRRGSSGGGARP